MLTMKTFKANSFYNKNPSQNLFLDEIERKVRGQGRRWKRLGGVLKYVENLFRRQRRSTGFAADRSGKRFWDGFS